MISALTVAQAMNFVSPADVAVSTLNRLVLENRTKPSHEFDDRNKNWIGERIHSVDYKQAATALLERFPSAFRETPGDRASAKPTLRDVLLGDGWRGDLELPSRSAIELRPPLDFSGD